MLIHREALELAKNAAPNVDGIPFTITCVNITEDGAVTITDGHHWLRMKAAADEPNLFDEIAEDGTDALSGPVLIPAEVVSAFNAAMKKKKAKKGMPVPHVVVAQQEDRVTLRSSDGKTTRTFLMDAIDANLTFPDVDKTILAHAPTHHVVLSIDLLSKIVRALKACKAPSVKLGLPADARAPIHLTAWTETGSVVGALMPMRDPEEEHAAPAAEQARSVVDDTHVSLTDTATGEVLFEGSSDALKAAAERANESEKKNAKKGRR